MSWVLTPSASTECEAPTLALRCRCRESAVLASLCRQRLWIVGFRSISLSRKCCPGITLSTARSVPYHEIAGRRGSTECRHGAARSNGRRRARRGEAAKRALSGKSDERRPAERDTGGRSRTRRRDRVAARRPGSGSAPILAEGLAAPRYTFPDGKDLRGAPLCRVVVSSVFRVEFRCVWRQNSTRKSPRQPRSLKMIQQQYRPRRGYLA
jgi:hypothetical protein